MWVTLIPKWLLWPFVVPFILLGGLGCSQGVAPLWSQANPCTSIKINPITKTVSIYSNDGKTFTAERIYARWGENEIEVTNLGVEDRSVENREANVAQMEVADRITGTAIRETFAGLTGMIREGLIPLRGASGSIDTPIGRGDITLGGVGAADGPVRPPDGQD